MANLPEENIWEEYIYQLEQTDLILGSLNGISNRQAKQLANRTLYLDNLLDSVNSKLNEVESKIATFSKENLSLKDSSNNTINRDFLTKHFIDINRFVAFSGTYSGNNTVYYSADGVNWNKITVSTLGDFYKFAYGREIFVGLSTRDSIYSSDGINWDTSDLHGKGVDFNHSSICYGAGKFICLGSSVDNETVRIFYSSDGIIWQNSIPSSLTSDSWCSKLCYANGKFVGVGGNSSNRAVIFYSTNILNWDKIALSSSLETLETICFGNGLFIVSGFNGNTVRSTDGRTWVTNTKLPYYVNDMIYANGKFICCYESMVDYVSYSTDGINWNKAFLPSSANWTCLCYGDNKFLIFSSNGIVASSTDGINWIQNTVLDLGIYSCVSGFTN